MYTVNVKVDFAHDFYQILVRLESTGADHRLLIRLYSPMSGEKV